MSGVFCLSEGEVGFLDWVRSAGVDIGPWDGTSCAGLNIKKIKCNDVGHISALYVLDSTPPFGGFLFVLKGFLRLAN